MKSVYIILNIAITLFLLISLFFLIFYILNQPVPRKDSLFGFAISLIIAAMFILDKIWRKKKYKN